MRPLRSLLIFVAAVFIGGALLAPWLYWGCDATGHQFPFFARVAKHPFHRFVHRSFLVIALVGLWPFLRSLGLTSFRDLGLTRPHGQWHRLGGGFALGFCSLACVATVALASDERRFNVDLSGAQAARKLAGIGLTAAVVAIMEELLFRGALYVALRRVWQWKFALILSSMVFAILHFMKAAEDGGLVRWSSGLEMLPRMLSGFVDLRAIFPGFMNLALVGAILALAYQRTGNLWFSIGLHGGWVFWLKSYNTVTTDVPHPQAWFWGSGQLIDGWLVLPVLLGCGFVVRNWVGSTNIKTAYNEFRG